MFKYELVWEKDKEQILLVKYQPFRVAEMYYVWKFPITYPQKNNV
jgi:hypothetical protein